MAAASAPSFAVGSAGAGLLGFYDPADEKPYFLTLGGASITVGVVLLLSKRWISRLMVGVR